MERELLSITTLIILVIVLLVLFAITNSKKMHNKVREKIFIDLKQIEELVQQKNPILYRDIIIRLDSLLAKSLHLKFGNNDSCGENLKKLRGFFNKEMYNNIWEVHKLRNRVVHENEELEFSQVSEGYKIIRKAIEKII
jgi:uncharacterized protein YutE (UPF0331/DUF86 family)